MLALMLPPLLPPLPNLAPPPFIFLIRVCPRTLFWITECSEHTSDGDEAQEDQGFEVEIFPILGEPPTLYRPHLRPSNSILKSNHQQVTP